MLTHKPRLTQRDVARVAGVSDMTVSRVMRGKGTVSAGTKAHVLKVVEAMGYVQNRLAGSLSQSRSNQIGVVIPSIVNSIFNQVTAGIAEELEKAGYNPVIGISDYDMKREESLVESMMAWRPAGFILTDFVHTERTRNIMINTGIPVVEMMETAGRPIDMCVGFNHAASAKVMAEHLFNKGYRRFGYLGWFDNDYAASTRYRTIRDFLAARDLPLIAPEIFKGSPDIPTGKQALAALLAVHPEVDVVVFSNDAAATGGIFHCQENGIAVPEHLAIAGFSGLRYGQVLPHPLTTIAFRRFEIGRRSARAILNRLVGQEVPQVTDLGFDLIIGASS